MVPTLHIDKLERGTYTTVLEEGGQPICDDAVFSNVAEAIRHFGGDVPNDMIQFVDIRYAGYCIGTFSTLKMRSDSEALASDLMSLYSAVISAEEQMQYQKQSTKV